MDTGSPMSPTLAPVSQDVFLGVRFLIWTRFVASAARPSCAGITSINTTIGGYRKIFERSTRRRVMWTPPFVTPCPSRTTSATTERVTFPSVSLSGRARRKGGGYMVEDVVTVGDELAPAKMIFGCGGLVEADGEYTRQDGMAGFGRGNTAFHAQRWSESGRHRRQRTFSDSVPRKW